MITCSFCLNKFPNDKVKDCPKCNLENLCENCLKIHIKQHEIHESKNSYEEQAKQLLDSILNPDNPLQKFDFGNETGVF